MSATNDQSWKLNFAIRRSKDISVNIEFNRTGVASSEDEPIKFQGDSRSPLEMASALDCTILLRVHDNGVANLN